MFTPRKAGTAKVHQRETLRCWSEILYMPDTVPVTVSRVAGRASGTYKTCVLYPQRFSSGTSGGRKLRVTS